jgi:undecaprenyl-diphosphatase
MKKLVLLFFCATAIGAHCFADSVYAFDAKKDAIIGGISLGAFIPTLFLDAEPGGTTPLGNVNFLDRPLMYAYNGGLDDASTWLQYGALVMPVLPVLGKLKDYNALLGYGVMYAEAFLLTSATKDILKLMVARNRPYTYFDGSGAPPDHDEDYYNSFPSGHTAFAFLGATFLSVTFSHDYPESKWKVPVIAGSYAVAASVACLRVGSGSHFLTDVLAGAAIGSLYGWLIPELHLKKTGGTMNLGIIPLPNGVMARLEL